MLLISVIILYLILVYYLRYQKSKYIANIKKPEEVFKELFSMEFPFMWLKALELSLLNTFPHKSVFTKLSIKKKFINDPEIRYDDTELILREIWEHFIDSNRGSQAVERLNSIHRQFNIDNESYLYVLANFVVTPVKLINEFEFRNLTQHEIDSLVITFIKLGDRMGINNIPTNYQGFVDIINQAYNSSPPIIVQNKKAKNIADSVLHMFLEPFPVCTHNIAKKIIFSLIDVPIREKLEYPQQSIWVRLFAKTILLIRAYFVKYFLPPRPRVFQDLRTPEEIGKSPRYAKYGKGGYRINGCPYHSFYENGYQIENLGKYKYKNNNGINKKNYE